MNVIVANKYQSVLATLDIEVIKSMNGEFEVDEIINTFQSFFFNKMILDITAIKDYNNMDVMQKLSMNLDMSKVILLLDDNEDSSSSEYLSKLISMGIYNFTRNKEGIMYLYNNPNSYRDVAHIQQLDELTDNISDKVSQGRVRILGIKNVTDHAGATTLIYMLKKQLEKNYSVVAVEIDKNDFLYFNDKNMISLNSDDLGTQLLKFKEADIILIDLNEYGEEDICNDILYLIEPSSIKLNRLMKRDRRIFETLKGKKIILNKSLLTSKDVLDFEYESKSKIFYNVPPLDERQPSQPILDVLLTKLGFIRQKIDEKAEKNKIFGLFKI